MKSVARAARPVKQATPKLAEIAARIGAHLKRFEADPAINNLRDPAVRLKPYFGALAWCHTGMQTVRVKYGSRQVIWTLSSTDALAYLAWLDAGNVGKHFEMPTEAAR